MSGAWTPYQAASPLLNRYPPAGPGNSQTRLGQLCESHNPNDTVVDSADRIESMLLLVCCEPNQDLV